MLARVVLMTFAALVLVSCAKDPVQVGQSNNGSINVEVLFDFDGCRMYRFSDAGRYVYFSKCQLSSGASWDEGGKSSQPQNVPTRYGR